MLKTDVIILLAVILQVDWDWSKIIGYTLAVLSGIVLGTAVEMKEKTFTKRSLALRLMQIFGLSVFFYYVWKFYITKIDFIFALFGISWFADTITSVGNKIGKMGITGYLKYLAGKIPQGNDEK